MNTTLYSDSRLNYKSNMRNSILTEEINKYRLTHSALSAPPEILKTERHRFVLSRGGLSTSKVKAREPLAKVRVVTKD
jgi:hypothetical protein